MWMSAGVHHVRMVGLVSMMLVGLPVSVPLGSGTLCVEPTLMTVPAIRAGMEQHV